MLEPDLSVHSPDINLEWCAVVLSQSDCETTELRHKDGKRYRSSRSSFVPISSSGILLSQTGIKTYQIQTVAVPSRVCFPRREA